MKNRGLNIVSIVVIIMYSFSGSYASSIVVDEEVTNLNLSPLVEYWADEFCDASIDYVYENKNTLAFVDSEMDYFNFNQLSHCPWLKFQITNSSNKNLKLLLRIDNHRLSIINYFIFRNGKQIEHVLTGDDFDFRQRPILNSNYLFPIEIASNDTLECFISLYRGTHSIHTNLQLQTYESFISATTSSRYGLGIFVGVSLFFVFGSFVSLLFFRERLVLLYFLMIVAMFIFCIRESGIGYEYIWGNGSKLLKHILVVSSPIIQVVGFMFFGITYFKTKINYPKMHRYLLWIFWILGGLIVTGVPLIILVSDSMVIYKLVSRTLIFTLQFVILSAFVLMLSLAASDFFKERRKESLAFVSVNLVHILFILAFYLKTMDYLWLDGILTYSLFPSFIFEMFMLTFIIFQKYKHDINEKNELEVKYNQNQIKIANALFEGEEMERQRIASDLHDSLGSLLSISKLYLNESEIVNKIEIENWLQKAQTETRRISNELMPKSLFTIGLATAIQDLCDRLEKENFVTIPFVKNELSFPYSDFQKIHIYRIVEGLLQNAIVKSHAKNININLTEFEQELNLIIEDDGIGDPEFDKSLSENIVARINTLKGDIHIDSTRGRGTNIVIDFELK